MYFMLIQVPLVDALSRAYTKINNYTIKINDEK
jgi:hypothetical protein